MSGPMTELHHIAEFESSYRGFTIMRLMRSCWPNGYETIEFATSCRPGPLYAPTLSELRTRIDARIDEAALGDGVGSK